MGLHKAGLQSKEGPKSPNGPAKGSRTCQNPFHGATELGATEPHSGNWGASPPTFSEGTARIGSGGQTNNGYKLQSLAMSRVPFAFRGATSHLSSQGGGFCRPHPEPPWPAVELHLRGVPNPKRKARIRQWHPLRTPRCSVNCIAAIVPNVQQHDRRNHLRDPSSCSFFLGPPMSNFPPCSLPCSYRH